MKVFVTGATGFIGTRLIRRLSQTNHQIVCLVRKTSKVKELQEMGVTLAEGDVTDKESVFKAMKGCDWVANLANIYSYWEPRSALYREVNVAGTQNVMECALDTGVAKVVHVSTFIIFGQPEDSPFTEKSKPGPVRFSEYARTKYDGDLVTLKLREEKALPLVIIYPGAVVGAGDPKATGQYFKNLVLGRLPVRVFENHYLTFVYVGDVADAIVRALEKPDNIGQGYLVCNQQFSFREINQMVRDISGVRLPVMALPDSLTMVMATLATRLADVTKKPPMLGMALDQMRTMRYDCRADGSKAERELGLVYTPIRTALEEYIASIKKQI